MQVDLEVRQSQHFEGDDWWSWAVWIEGTNEELNKVEFVEWRLHPTFPNPIRRVCDRGTKFRLETGGWGTFRVIGMVQFKDGSQRKLQHDLQLNYPSGAQARA